MRRIFTAVVCSAALVFLASSITQAAEDDWVNEAPVGSNWVGGAVGIAKRPGERPIIKSNDVRLIIVERDGEKFAGIATGKNDTHRGEVRGTIKRNGAVQFIITKDLTGGSTDVVGLVKFKGKLKDGRMTLTFQSNVGTKRIGTIALEQKKSDEGE